MIAVIVGSRGQDGLLLRDYLQARGIDWIGLTREGTCEGTCKRFDGQRISIYDFAAVNRLISLIKPQHVYYLAAHHSSSENAHVSDALVDYGKAHQTHCAGLLNFLEAIVQSNLETRLFYASSSLVFSGRGSPVQTEETNVEPQGIYGITKEHGMQICRHYRERHSVYAACGILYNHESHLRRPQFLSRKIIDAAISASRGSPRSLAIGDPDARADWGHADDFVDSFYRILSLQKGDDFIVATGELHSVRDWLNIAFNHFQLDWRKFVKQDPTLLHRKSLPKQGNFEKLHAFTGWKPRIGFRDMIVQIINKCL